MDLEQLQTKLGLPENRKVLRKAQELQRLSRVHFNSSEFGVGEVCKAVLCFQLACQLLEVPFNRQKAIRWSGVSEKAYLRSTHAIENALGHRKKVDVRELALQFGCVRLIDAVNNALALYKQRFVASLPEARRASADFNRPVFTCVAFYLCAKKNKLKVDKAKLMELSGPPDSEFSNVVVSMMDLCNDVLGIRGEKRSSESVKSNAGKKKCLVHEDSDSEDDSNDDSDLNHESLDYEDRVEVPGFRRSEKSLAEESYKTWKESVVSAREALKAHVSVDDRPAKRKQQLLKFGAAPAPPVGT